jgi:5'-3' exonuclease
MSNTYILIDSMNQFMRCKNAVSPLLDVDTRIGMALHITLSSAKSMWNAHNGTHLVFLKEGRSWRRDFYTPYKANRKTLAAQKSPKEAEIDEAFMKAYGDLMQFLEEKTNVTVLQQHNAEADDLIAEWIRCHPNDQHVIISSDGDFVQLLQPNVRIYNGVTNILYTHEGIFDDRGRKLEFTLANDGKVKTGKPNPNFVPPTDWIQRSLFYKCIRGDVSDNIFSAYPGARQKGSKNKIGVEEAYNDIGRQGFDYNNFMLQKWVDHHRNEHVVRDDFHRNRTLIDLSMQPEDIKQQLTETVKNSKDPKQVSNVGFHFMKFAGTWNLQRLGEQAADVAKMLNARIPNS